MKNLLDNEQIEKIQDTAEMAAQTFDTIGRNNEPFGIIIANAASRAGALFFAAMGDELNEHIPALANLAYDAANRIQEITEEAEDQLCLL